MNYLLSRSYRLKCLSKNTETVADFIAPSFCIKYLIKNPTLTFPDLFFFANILMLNLRRIFLIKLLVFWAISDLHKLPPAQEPRSPGPKIWYRISAPSSKSCHHEYIELFELGPEPRLKRAVQTPPMCVRLQFLVTPTIQVGTR